MAVGEGWADLASGDIISAKFETDESEIAGVKVQFRGRIGWKAVGLVLLPEDIGVRLPDTPVLVTSDGQIGEVTALTHFPGLLEVESVRGTTAPRADLIRGIAEVIASGRVVAVDEAGKAVQAAARRLAASDMRPSIYRRAPLLSLPLLPQFSRLIRLAGGSDATALQRCPVDGRPLPCPDHS
jgi:hypothetical protein